MSDERFSVDDDGIYDNQEKKHFKFIAYDWVDCDIYECCEKLNEQQDIIDKQELRLQHLEELLELSQNLNKSYREKLIDRNLKMVIDV